MDKYGYLTNPTDAVPTKKGQWFWIVGTLGACILVYFLIGRPKTTAARLQKLSATKGLSPYVLQYTVTAPASTLDYHGAGMPFGIQQYGALAEDFHYETDNNGIARLVTDSGVPGGLIQVPTGQVYFVAEEELNLALAATREENADILMTIMPYAMVGQGYLAYCTSGPHIGQEVYVTLKGQIGRPLNKSDGGELTFVPLDVIDQTLDIWLKYVRPERSE